MQYVYVGLNPHGMERGELALSTEGRPAAMQVGQAQVHPSPSPRKLLQLLWIGSLCGQSSFRGRPGKGVSVAEAIPGGCGQWKLGLLVFPAAGQHVPVEGAAQGPGPCVHHMPCSSSALQDLAKHSMMMHTMEFCAIVMKKGTTDTCLMTENMCTHLFNTYLLKNIPNNLLLSAKSEKSRFQNSLYN